MVKESYPDLAIPQATVETEWPGADPETIEQNGGTLLIGASPGETTIHGDYTMGAAAQLPIELGGTIPGAGHDHLAVTGTWTQGGTLDVLTYGGYAPQRGDRFDLFDWGTRAGSFATMNLPTLGADLAWDLVAFDTAGTLAVISKTNDRVWDGTAGPWHSATDWTGDTVPTAAQDAHISNGGSVEVPTGVAAACASLGVGQYEGQAGQLNVAGGSLDIGGDLFIGVEGTGAVAISEGALTVGSTIVLGSGGSLDLSGGTLAAGTLDASAGGSFTFTGGDLSLVRCLGDLTNAGDTLRPGASPGLLEVFGDYAQGPDAWLEIELGGLVRGTEYDALDIEGEMLLDGGLRVILTDGFMPTAGNTFQVFGAQGGMSGEFASIELPDLDNPDLYWSMGRLYDEGILALGRAPEPGSLSLLALGLLALARRRRS
jgi:hypothetical protein